MHGGKLKKFLLHLDKGAELEIESRNITNHKEISNNIKRFYGTPFK